MFLLLFVFQDDKTFHVEDATQTQHSFPLCQIEDVGCLLEKLNEWSKRRYWSKSKVLHWWGNCIDDFFPDDIPQIETIMVQSFPISKRQIGSKILIELSSEIVRMLCSPEWCVKLFLWGCCLPKFWKWDLSSIVQVHAKVPPELHARIDVVSMKIVVELAFVYEIKETD